MPSDASKPIKLSFVVPILNEAESLETLVNSIEANIPADSEDSYEIILVDDGSDDNSWEEIIRIHDVYVNRIQGLRFRRNFGKAAALQAGFDIAKGDIVFTLDADLQDDPTEIPNFIQKLEEGYDIVSGWKQSRQDPASKTLPSKLFNFVTRAISGVPLHDFNCGFKAYRLQAVNLSSFTASSIDTYQLSPMNLASALGNFPLSTTPESTESPNMAGVVSLVDFSI